MTAGDRVMYSRVERASFGRSARTTSVVVVLELLTKRVRIQMPSGVTRDVKQTSLTPLRTVLAFEGESMR